MWNIRNQTTDQDRIDESSTLDELLDALSEMADSRNVNMQALPTFGGNEPDETDGVWSWDRRRLLIEDDEGYSIIDRDGGLG